ncbi:MAG: glycosyltransferase family 4 protein [Phycisphaerae bacterium]
MSLRILHLAAHCNPEWVSVPLVGYSHQRALAGVCDAHLVTQWFNADALKRAGLRETADFTALDASAVAAPISDLAEKIRGGSGKGWTTKMALAALSQPYFERLVWQRFGPEIAQGKWDIVHQITPLSPTLPSRIAAKSRHLGVPFVWGPLNGGVPWPAGYDAARRQEREYLSYVRDVYKLHPGYRQTREAAAAILVASRDTYAQLPPRARAKTVYIPENGIDPARFHRRRTRTAAVPLRAVFLGRLVPYKGCDMLLAAAAGLIRAGKLTLRIIGEGPQRAEIERQIARENLGPAVTLTGWVEHAKVQDLLADADLLTFPSIREFGGGVAPEAMAVGLPAVVPDYGGLGELVSPATGWLLPIAPREQLIAHLRTTLESIVADPGQIDEKSAAAVRRVHQSFTWEAKARQTLAVYKWVTGTADKPDFGMPLHENPA